MEIPCIACQSMIRFDSSIVKANGSLVKCPECHFILMLYPPERNEEPIPQDTSVDHLISSDFFDMEHASKSNAARDESSKESKKICS